MKSGESYHFTIFEQSNTGIFMCIVVIIVKNIGAILIQVVKGIENITE